MYVDGLEHLVYTLKICMEELAMNCKDYESD